MKRAGVILSTLLLIILLGGFLYMKPLMPIITGYAAKNLSSGIFVGNRTQESLEATDLNFSFIRFVNNSVDTTRKTVSSRFLWHSSRTTFVNGYGSILLNDYTVGDIQARPYPIVPHLPEHPDTIAWPMGDLIADTIPSGIDLQQLNIAMEQAFADTIPYKGTFAVMVTYKGQPVAERYAEGFGPENLFLSWSMAKSFTNALTGIMVKEGKLELDAPADIEEWQQDERRQITIRHLMQMNSGLEWNEDYGNSSDVNNMLHKEGDMAKFAISKQLEYAPGSVFEYASGSTNIVSSLMRKAIGNDADYLAFPREKLFNRIGMRSATFEVDASGTFVGSSYLYATLRDYTRFGLLYLNNGNWLGEEILTENWVEYSTTEANGSDGTYGAFFWLNKSGSDYPDVPRDMFCCRGHDGQYIYIIPSKELVIVRTGFSKEGEFDQNGFLAGILDAIR
ncbi:MAG TPA: serine hydrolase [Proteiniphilum sp.]|nr:serine hydrolase [Proteiniphilum sp.]HPJ50302.1 serine hydrolase [Proteiniphilum sp.]HPR19011.1 serine hydrolase [Proteiniphilum sp.]